MVYNNSVFKEMNLEEIKYHIKQVKRLYPVPKLHRETWAEIDLDAIAHNVKQAKNLHPDKTLFAVVKANGYGHGDVEVAETALESGAEIIAVSSFEEGLHLRQHGIDSPILVMGMTCLKDLNLVTKYDISITVHDLKLIKDLVKMSFTQTLKVHLKIDTGMHRIGIISHEEIVEAFELLAAHPQIEIEGVSTHMATADDDLEYLNKQVEKFESALAKLDLSQVKYVHFENTATLFQFSYDFDQGIRLGIGMYGVNPGRDLISLDFKLKPTLKLYSCLSQAKQIKKGDKVGYGATYEAKQDEWIGVMPIGYADGWIRAHQGRYVIVDGHECEIIGRVCMDQMMIRLPGEYSIGTRVTLIGEGMPVERVSDEIGTIPYETFCLIGDRVPRVYMKDGKLIKRRKMRFE